MLLSNALPADSRISLLCNPISSSPYFPSSPSGSLAGFVYWRRGWEEGDPTGPGRPTSVCGRRRKGKKTTINSDKPTFLSFRYTLLTVAGRRAVHWAQIGACMWISFLFLNSQTKTKKGEWCFCFWAATKSALSAFQRAEVLLKYLHGLWRKFSSQADKIHNTNMKAGLFFARCGTWRDFFFFFLSLSRSLFFSR